MRKLLLFSSLLGGLLLSACSPPPPIKVGFIGGLSDRNSDNGQAGLDAVILAVEEFNRAGGANGRLVELLPQDDAQNPDTAARAARELVQAKVEAVIGPFTSSMAAVIVPITAQAGVFQISPTITAMEFYGKDDNLFRINRTTRDNAREYAEVMHRLGQSRVAVAFDLRNRKFTESWLSEYRDALKAQGGEVLTAVPFESSDSVDFDAVVQQMVATKPEGLLFIAGALDVAKLAQSARRASPALPLSASEWAATQQLIEFGGPVVEDLLIVQAFDRDDNSERFRDFVDAYFKRFQHNPGYSSVAAYDAATVLLKALRNRKDGESVKAAALRSGPYEGLQQEIVFDDNGDTPRKVFFTKIEDGHFRRLP